MSRPDCSAPVSRLAVCRATARLTPGTDGELPERLLVVPWGEVSTRQGAVICNQATVEQLPGNQVREKYDRVALDFQHNTVKAGAAGEPVKVAGYGTPEVVPGEGIYLSAISYTSEGRELLRGGHYPDISPAVVRNERGEVIFLHSVGAVRQGEIDGLTLYEAQVAAALPHLFAAESTMDNTDTSDTTNTPDLQSALALLLETMGADLPDSPTPEALASAALELADQVAGSKKADGEGGEGGDAEPAAMAAADQALADRVTALEASHAAGERRALVERASREGKVIPLDDAAIATLPVTTLSAMIDKLPVTVPLESRTVTAGAGHQVEALEAGSQGKAITPEDRHVAQLMGVDPATL